MSFAYARIYWNGHVTAVMRVHVLGPSAEEPGYFVIEIPWTRTGEPAGLLRRGMAVSLPAEEIIDNDAELQTQLDALRITDHTVKHAISEIVAAVTSRRNLSKSK
jgi:hypothetical protein